MTIPRKAIEAGANDIDVWLRNAGIFLSRNTIDSITKSCFTAALATEGFVVVPKEATDAMYIAALGITRDPGYGHCHDAVGGAVYRAMISAYGGEDE